MIKTKHIPAALITAAVVWFSFYKDTITPDYLNTPNAYFLNPADKNYASIASLHLHYPLFWLKSYAYSLLFVLLPSYTIQLLYGRDNARLSFLLLITIAIAEYILLFAQQDLISIHILPKINRYFHSPIILLFLIVAFRLNQFTDERPH